MISVKESQRGLSFDIHVIPYASRAEIAGIQDGTLKVRVTAPPVEAPPTRPASNCWRLRWD